MKISLRPLRLLAVTLGLAAASISAHAWTAMAYTEFGDTFVHSNAVSKEEAEKLAMEGCVKNDNKGGRCSLSKLAAHGEAVVIYKNRLGSWSVNADGDPLEADRKAKASCEEHYKNCFRAFAVWDEGHSHVAVAKSEEGHTYTSWGAMSRTLALKEALAGCDANASKPGTCTILPDLTLSGPVHMARASSSTIDARGISVSPKGAKDAEKKALKLCAAHPAKPKDCKIVFSQANPPSKPAPASMKMIAVKK